MTYRVKKYKSGVGHDYLQVTYGWFIFRTIVKNYLETLDQCKEAIAKDQAIRKEIKQFNKGGQS